MSEGLPPQEPGPEPARRTLPAGQLIWRVTRAEFVRSASVFNKDLAPVDGPPDLLRPGSSAGPGEAHDAKAAIRASGRVDATEEDPGYSYCYAALDDLTAIAETLLRDVPFSAVGRFLPWKDVAGRCLTLYETLRPLSLVALTTAADLAQVHDRSPPERAGRGPSPG